MHLYIAGPMRGYPEFNFPMFDWAAKVLRSMGYTVSNPAEHDREVWPDLTAWPGYRTGDITACPRFDFTQAMAWDLQQVCLADGLVLLPGWERSTGARLEHEVASSLKKPIFTLDRSKNRYVTTLRALTPRVVVGLTGYAQVGKDTVAALLVREYGFQRLALADILREMLYALNPLVQVVQPDTQISETVGLQQFVDRWGWDRAKQIPEHLHASPWTVRRYLQRLGTEAGRDILGEDVWVDIVVRRAQALNRVVITDIRFPNEAKAIRDLGGHLVRVTRAGVGPVTQHASETAIDSLEVDHVLANDGDIQDLQRALAQTASTLGWT